MGRLLAVLALCAQLSASGVYAIHAEPCTARPQLRRAVVRLRGGSLRETVPEAARRLFAPPRSGAAESTLVAIGPLPRVAHHVRGVVFGGMDGILTTFAVLAAVIGSRQSSTELTLVIGFSTLIADALSMAAGEYLSAKAEAEMGEAAGAELSAARNEDEPGPLEKGFAMFLAFTTFGSMPLLGFIAAAVISTKTGAPQRASSLLPQSTRKQQPRRQWTLAQVATATTQPASTTQRT